MTTAATAEPAGPLQPGALPGGAPEVPLGRTVTRGAGLGVAATLINRVLSIVAQLCLARLLVRDDFGLVGQVTVLSALTVFFSVGGIQEVLTQRQRNFRHWAPPAFWLSLTSGMIASVGLVAMAPLGAWFYGEPRVIPLLLILAPSLPFASVQAVFLARLAIDMRFALLAVLTVAQFVIQTIVSIGLAWMGLGATAVILGTAIANIALLVMTIQVTRVSPGLRPQVRRWRYLMGDVGRLYVGRCAFVVAAVADCAVLGSLSTTSIVGGYTFALNLAMQPPRMIYTAFQAVLLPSLSRIDDPVRQIDAFVRGARLVAAVIVPLVAVQIVLAEPFIVTLFGAVWRDTTLMFQILSVAGAFYSVGLLNSGLVLAQRRNQAWCVQQIITLAVMVVVIPGALWGQEVGVAIAVCAGQALTAFSFHYVAIRGHVARFLWPVADIYFSSYLIAIACGAVAYGIDRYGVLPFTGRGSVRLIVGAVTYPIYFPLLVRLLTPGLSRDLWSRIIAAAPARFRLVATSAAS